MAAPESAPPQRSRREWLVLVGLVMAATTLSVLAPGLLLVVPFALLSIVLPPRRPVLQISAVALLALMIGSSGSGSLWYFERVWTILLGLWFLTFVRILPDAGFITRAMSTVAASAASCAAFLVVDRRAFIRLDGEIATRLKEAAKYSADNFTLLLKDKNPEAVPLLTEKMHEVARLQVLVFPALIALASMAALGAGWWLYRRLAAADPHPLRPLREFRFSDHLVWLLVIGAVMLVALPANAIAHRAGSNLVTFMIALYALRGLAVFIVIVGTPGFFGMLVGAVLFVIFPLVPAATILVGLSDTWLDIRAKRLKPRPGS